MTHKKSQGHFEGVAAQRAAEHVASHASPSSLASQLCHHLQNSPPPPHPPSPQGHNPSHGTPSGLSSAAQRSLVDTLVDARARDVFSRPSVIDYSETSSESCMSNIGGSGLVDDDHRSIDVNAMKNSDVHRDSGPLELATTVLKSLPMQDTLAILIILTHVPSLSLTIIYTAFTFLTFVPPVTASSGMNITLASIFDGSSTMPSLFTLGCMDLFFLLVWLFLWQPVQDIILDFAKPVIAITLGGGASAKGATSRGVTACFTWVLVHHLLRGTRSHWSRFIRQIPEEWRVPFIFSGTLNPEAAVYDKRNAYGLVRSVLAIHILTQGLVRYIREWYLRREKVHAATGASDPEAGKLQGGMVDAANETSSSAADNDVGPQLAHHPATAKKKRKQSAQVRLQQPLWAALASTKIVVMKEYEQSHAASETAGTNATDIHNLGSAPFDRQPRQIWISYIGSDEVCFSTSEFARQSSELSQESNSGGIDAYKPFFVKVNNALWQPTRLFPIEDSDEETEGTRWTGDIYGLRPVSKYVCEFVDSQTNKVIFTTSIRTAQETFRESDGASPAVCDGKHLQPDSPTTTLKTSIGAAEARLAEEKNRLKLLRKDCKTKINALKKENELTDNQLSSAGSHDEKYRQKIRQQETQKAQAEREMEGLAEQIKNFEVALELNDRKKKVERAYAAEKKLFDAARKEFEDYKAKLEGNIKAKEVERSNLNTRRNKVAMRIAKAETELNNMTDANNRGLDEVERRRQEHNAWEEQCAHITRNYEDRIAQVRNANIARVEHIRGAQSQLSSFHEYLNSANGLPYDIPTAHHHHSHHHHHQQQAQPQSTLPSPSTSTWNMNPAAPPHYPMSMWTGSLSDLTQNSSAMMAHGNSPNRHHLPTAAPFKSRSSKLKGRSSSMLSDVSGFTQSSDEDVTESPIAPYHALRSSQRGEGGGAMGDGGSGSSGSDSVREPSSPA